MWKSKFCIHLQPKPLFCEEEHLSEENYNIFYQLVHIEQFGTILHTGLIIQVNSTVRLFSCQVLKWSPHPASIFHSKGSLNWNYTYLGFCSCFILLVPWCNYIMILKAVHFCAGITIFINQSNNKYISFTISPHKCLTKYLRNLEIKPVTNNYYLLACFNKVRALCVLSSEIILL